MVSDNFKAALAQLSQAEEEYDKQFANQAEEAWDKMSHDEQLMAFYSVVKRLTKGELDDDGSSYRYILYNIFGFGPEAYRVGMNCGFMRLHNAIEVKNPK